MNLENPGKFTILELEKKVLAKPIQILKLYIVLFHINESLKYSSTNISNVNSYEIFKDSILFIL